MPARAGSLLRTTLCVDTGHLEVIENILEYILEHGSGGFLVVGSLHVQSEL